MPKVNKRMNTAHVKAATKALEAVPSFLVTKTATTVVAKTGKGVELYRALKINARADLWMVAQMENLFNEEGK
jgi:hypothetical protein